MAVIHNLRPVLATSVSAVASGSVISNQFKTFMSQHIITANARDVLLNQLVSMGRFLMLLPGMTLVALGSIINTITTMVVISNQFQDMIANPNPSSSDPPAMYDFIVGIRPWFKMFRVFHRFCENFSNTTI